MSHAFPLNDSVAADINNDGKPDLVSGTRALSTAGTVLADSTYRTDFTAVADLDRDGLCVHRQQHRRIWNQHAYSVTNIDEDGTVLKAAAPN